MSDENDLTQEKKCYDTALDEAVNSDDEPDFSMLAKMRLATLPIDDQRAWLAEAITETDDELGKKFITAFILESKNALPAYDDLVESYMKNTIEQDLEAHVPDNTPPEDQIDRYEEQQIEFN